MIGLDQNTTAATAAPAVDPRAERLFEIALLVDKYRADRKLTLEQLKEQLPEIGSDKTLSKLLKRDVSELNLDNQLANYTIVEARIAGEDIAATEIEDKAVGKILPDLTLTLKLRDMYNRLHKVTDNNRVGIICIEGGGGKTTAARALQKQWGTGRIKRLQALAIWEDNPSAMMADLADLLGITDVKIARHARYVQVRNALKDGKRKCVIIDEAHYLGPRCLSVLVNLINDTPGEFILLAKPLLWKNLERSAYDACTQIKVNRLDEYASYDELTVTDYAQFLSSRVKLTAAQANTAATQIMTQAKNRGHMAFARDVINKAREAAKDSPVTMEHLKDATDTVAKKLGRVDS